MRTVFLTIVLSLGTLTGCGGADLSAVGDVGVTPGGVQDIGYTRDLIANGLIPSAEDYTVEGLFSEHDLPLEGEACTELLCPRAAAAYIEPVDGSGGELLVQLGFATDLEAGFERPDLSLAVAIDISGSMSGEKLETSKAALHEVVDQLDGDDRMALVAYGSDAEVRQELGVMDDAGRQAMHDAIDRLTSNGSTAMEDGLSTAIGQLLQSAPPSDQAQRRVFLLTDAQPNVGATGVGSFVHIVSGAADEHEIGVTVWGVGLDLGAELVSEMSSVRGGNAYHFTDVEGMQERVREEFDFMVTPLAYDLEVTGVPVADLAVDRTWGAPVDPSGDVAFGAATLFPSSRDGGMGISLAWADGAPILAEAAPGELVTLSASWVPVGATAEETGEITVFFEGGELYGDEWAAADDLGVYKMGALVDEVLALDAGALFCAGELDSATTEERILEAARRLDERATLIEEEALAVEAELMLALVDNVRGGTGNCNGGGPSGR